MLRAGPAREPDDPPVTGLEGSLRAGEILPGPHTQCMRPRFDGNVDFVAAVEGVDARAVEHDFPGFATATYPASSGEPRRCRRSHGPNPLAPARISRGASGPSMP